MKNRISDSRRDFIRNALGLVVVAGTAPTVALGRLLPSLSENASGQIEATYVIRISDYPTLQIPGGSVKLTSPEQLKLNPEHLEHQDINLRFSDNRRGWYPIAVTRVAESGTDAFCAVSTFCRHGQGYQVNYKGDIGEVGYFECPHEKSQYSACGVWKKGEGPDLSDLPNQNLLQFTATFDGENITLNGVIAGVDNLDRIPDTTFLDVPRPSPATSFAVVRYGLASATSVRITIVSPEGREIQEIAHGHREQGVHYADLVLDNVPSGTYYIRLLIDGHDHVQPLIISR